MGVKPILFNTEMVKAILDGRKTCTRRKIPIDIVDFCDIDHDGELLSYENSYGDFINPEKLWRYSVCPRNICTSCKSYFLVQG